MRVQGNIFIEVIFAIFLFVTAIQLFYYLYYYLAVYLHKPLVILKNNKPVSIIICAKNEAVNLKKFLPAILKQDYPDFEVIVVNDCSEDDSKNILEKYQEEYSNLKVSTIKKDEKFAHNKKFAQFIGIKAAKNEILLFTDADCEPESAKWLKMMASHFDDKISFVLGYGGYLKEKGLLNKYIRYDSATIAMQYLGMAIRGLPYMGVGRNLAYRSSLFFANKGYGSHNHLISGDDDLFVNTNANSNNTRVEFRQKSHTRSIPCRELKEWKAQKKRHLTTGPYYKLRDKFLLLTEPLSRILFYTAFIILISLTNFWPIILGVFVFRMIAQIIVFALTQKKLNEPGLLTYSIFFDIFSPIINSIIFLTNTGNRSRKIKWK